MPLILVRSAIASSSSAGRAAEVEFAGQDELGEAADIAGLLPRHAGGAHLLIGRGEQIGEVGRGAEGGFELGPHGAGGGDADLLADDGAEQGLRAGLAGPRLGHAVAAR